MYNSKWPIKYQEVYMFELQDFEDQSSNSDGKYWIAHNLMNLLGYESWPSFKGVIQKSQSLCAQLGVDIEDEFISFEHEVFGKSYKLTRFACLLISQQADSSKPQVAKAQVTLAKFAESVINKSLSNTEFTRVEERGKLTIAEKQLNGIASAAGVQTYEFGIFKDAGVRGMYNMSTTELRNFKGSDPKKTLYDFMGLTELAANTFRITQTSERIKSQQAQGLNQTSNIANSVGKEVRDIMIKSSGIAPENLDLESDIKKIKTKMKTTSKQLKKADS